MPEEVTPEQQKAADEVVQGVMAELAQGKKKEKIVKELVKQGWNEASALDLVSSVEQQLNMYLASPEGRKTMADKHKKHMLYGVLWAVGGTIVTAATYEAASGGGTYVVAWGAIAFGIFDFFRGLFGWMKYRD